MKIATRISSGYVILSLLALACGGAGYWGVSKLSGSLEFITGPAWDTADGAMEGTIGIEAQMLGIERTLTGDKTTASKLIADGRQMEDEALGRMAAAGLAETSQVDRASAKRREFRAAGDKLLASYATFDKANKKLAENFFQFQKFMENVEEMGDGQVEALRKNPGKTTSWGGDLRLRWEAADGAMESQIGLLQQVFYYGRLIRGEDQAATLAALKESEKFMGSAMQEIIDHPLFRSKSAPGRNGTYSQNLSRFVAQHKSNFTTAISAYLAYNEDKKVYEQLANELLEIVAIVEEAGDSKVEGEQAAISTAISSSYFLVFLTVIMSVVIAVVGSAWIIRSIMNPLGKTIDAMNDIAEGEGDLTRRLNASGNDEISILASGFNKFADKISGVLMTVRQATDSIVAGSREIAAGNTNLSQRTEEQASSLEETASSMEEMTGTVKQNADSAAEAKQLADANRQRAASGAEVVHRTVEAMGEINTSSAKIADIIGTIDGIAFQTNLLALNAAVEAARAGEQGRGFAVVASEVRTLAQRSADAAKEIKTLIEDSVDKVKVGTQLVDESGRTLEEIITGTQKVADIIAEIAAASLEQASGIDQVNNAVTQMDNMTQDNAALVEEAAAASRSMEEQANVLMEQVSYFKLDTSNRLGGPSASSAPFIQHGGNGHAQPARASSDRTHLEHLKQAKAKPKADESSEWEQF